MWLMDLFFIMLPLSGPLVTLVAMEHFPSLLCPADTVNFSSQCQGTFACKQSDRSPFPFLRAVVVSCKQRGVASRVAASFSSGKMGDEHHELLHKALKLAGKPGRFLSFKADTFPVGGCRQSQTTIIHDQTMPRTW